MLSPSIRGSTEPRRQSRRIAGAPKIPPALARSRLALDNATPVTWHLGRTPPALSNNGPRTLGQRMCTIVKPPLATPWGCWGLAANQRPRPTSDDSRRVATLDLFSDPIILTHASTHRRSRIPSTSRWALCGGLRLIPAADDSGLEPPMTPKVDLSELYQPPPSLHSLPYQAHLVYTRQLVRNRTPSLPRKNKQKNEKQHVLPSPPRPAHLGIKTHTPPSAP